MFGLSGFVAIVGAVVGIAGARKNSRRAYVSGAVMLVAGFLYMVITRPPSFQPW